MNSISCCLCKFSANNEIALDIHIRKSHQDIFQNLKEMANPTSDDGLDQSTASVESSFVEDGSHFTSFEFQSTPISDDEMAMSHGRSEDSQLGSSTISTVGDETNSFLESTMSILNAGHKKYLRCNKCNFQGHTNYQLRKHKLSTHVSSEEKDRLLLHCRDCSFIGESYHYLKKHRSEFHIKSRKTDKEEIKAVVDETFPEPGLAKDLVDESATLSDKPPALESPKSTSSIKSALKKGLSGKRSLSKNVSFQEEVNKENVTIYPVKKVKAIGNLENAPSQTIVDAQVSNRGSESDDVPSYLGLRRSPQSDEANAPVLRKLRERRKADKVNTMFIEAVAGLMNHFLDENTSSIKKFQASDAKQGLPFMKNKPSLCPSETEVALHKKISDLESALADKSSKIAILQTQMSQIAASEEHLQNLLQTYLSLLTTVH